MKPGRFNAITDVEGIGLGHFTDTAAMSGVTCILAAEGAVAGVDVRGSAPGTRETECIAPINLVQKVQAVVLSGGSVYGLAASDGVVHWLAEQGKGFPLGEGQVAPIVPGAVLYDLGRGADYVPPITPDWGRRACRAASGGEVRMGCVGAGTGAYSGGIKGGFGSASLVLDSGLTVAAAVAVNSLGSTINPATGIFWEKGLEMSGEFGPQARQAVKLPTQPEGEAGKNTTIAVVATDAVLSKVQAQKIAQMAHDGMARAIRPSHTMFDGDTIFCLATGKLELPRSEGFFVADEAQSINQLGHGAADCLSRAIIHGILAAQSLGGMTAFCDLPQRRD
jgi:L-aminopeptidase/D-esterase-like protein